MYWSVQAVGLQFRHTDNINHWRNALTALGLPTVSEHTISHNLALIVVLFMWLYWSCALVFRSFTQKLQTCTTKRTCHELFTASTHSGSSPVSQSKLNLIICFKAKLTSLINKSINLDWLFSTLLLIYSCQDPVAMTPQFFQWSDWSVFWPDSLAMHVCCAASITMVKLK